MRLLALVLIACGGPVMPDPGGSGGGGSSPPPSCSGTCVYTCSGTIRCTGIDPRTFATQECASSSTEAKAAAESGGTCIKSASCVKSTTKC